MIEDHTLVYVYSGELLVVEGNRKTKVHSGECVFIKKDNRVNMTKQPKGDEQFGGIFMVFNRNFLREFFQTMDKNELPSDSEKLKQSVIKLPQTPDITSLFQSMVPYFDSAVKPTEQLMKLKLHEGVYSLLNIDKKFYSCLFDFTEPWKIDILDFMDSNYMYDLSIEDIANYTGRSLATFKRDFKKISPISPQKWLIEKRLKVAYDKIQNEKKMVSDVYLEVGFKNLSHFSSAFKRQYGHSPTR
jgi:AraC-like DNA-binding protein